MSRSIRFFSNNTFDGNRLLGKRRSHGRFPRKQLGDELEEGPLLKPSSATSNASTGESSEQTLDDIILKAPLCPTAQEHPSLTQRVIVRMDRHLWKMSPRRGDSMASLEFPPHRDEMLLHDSNGHECGVIIPTRSSTAQSHCEYNVYSFHRCSEDQSPAMESRVPGVPSFYFHARFCAEPSNSNVDDSNLDCFRFHCYTYDGRHFIADKILWTTFQSWAFCIKQVVDSTVRTAARVTCLTTSQREVLVYPRVDPILMVAFVSVMEEVVLVSSL
jgi:hypothetical protein